MLTRRQQAQAEFEWALHRVVERLGAPLLSPVLGIQQRYISRMANPNDQGAHFRARDLIPTTMLGLRYLSREVALAPLGIAARAVGYMLVRQPREPRERDLLRGLAMASRCMGDLGECSILAIDPRGPAGRVIDAREVRAIAQAGHRLQTQVAGIVTLAQALHRGGRP